MILYLYTLPYDYHGKSSNPVIIQSHCIIDRTPCAVDDIPVTSSFSDNWNFVPLIPLHFFHPSTHPPPLWQSSVCSLYL